MQLQSKKYPSISRVTDGTLFQAVFHQTNVFLTNLRSEKTKLPFFVYVCVYQQRISDLNARNCLRFYAAVIGIVCEIDCLLLSAR